MQIPNYRKLTKLEVKNAKGKKYKLLEPISYYSEYYDKNVSLPVGYLSDGASGAADIRSLSWWVHDKLCDTGKFDDDSLCTNWQASKILRRILWQEWSWEKPFRLIRGILWSPATWLFGGGEARKNGMW